jgi:hypothetical protein
MERQSWFGARGNRLCPEERRGPSYGLKMTTQASGFTRVEGCDLCRAVRMTSWYHEDDVCWIAECDVCDVPMVVCPWLYPGRPEKRTFHLLSGADRSCAPYNGRHPGLTAIPRQHSMPPIIGVPPVACSR